MKYLLDDIIKYYESNKEIKKNINKNGIFDNFQRPFIYFFYNKVKEIIGRYSFCDLNKQILEESLIADFIANLIDSSMRTLIYDFNEEYTGVYDIEGDKEYKLKDASYTSMEKIRLLFCKYPILKEIIELKINYRLDLIAEILGRLKKDKDEIREKLNMDIDNLTNIQLGQGDMHNNGKTVAILTFDRDNKIIYKPRSLSIDICFNKILEYVNSKNKKVKLYISKNIDKKDYGWQEFIKYDQCKSKEEVEYYFYSIGALLAIVYLLGTSDMHYENIIAFGKYPVIIDLETLMTNRSRVELKKGYTEYLVNSVLSTLMIPSKMKISNIDMDISGVGGVIDQVSSDITSFQLVNNFKNNISLEKIESRLTAKNNAVILDGKLILPESYVYKIEEGFKDISILVINDKKSFIDVINYDQCKVRQVLRATYIYALYLSASQYPKYLKSKESYDLVFDVLNSSNSNIFNNEILNIEIDALKRRNVPYFYTKINTTSLYYIDKSGIEREIKNYYKKSLKDILEDNINNYSELKMQHQLRLIRLSFVKENSTGYNSSNRIKYPIDLEGCIEKVISLIQKYSFGKKQKYIIDLSLCEDLNMLLMNYSLYEGGSVFLLLNYFAHYKSDNKLKQFAHDMLSCITKDYPLYEGENISAYEGIGSLIYIYYNLYKLWAEKEYLDKYNEMIVKLNKGIENDTYEYKVDYLNGASSIIVLLSKIYKDNNSLVVKEVALKILNKLEAIYSHGAVGKTGLAHGYSGVALAFIIGGSTFNESRFVEKGKSIVLKEDSYYDESIQNWRDIRSEQKNDLVYWCYGASGITLARYMMLQEIDCDFLLNDFNKGFNKIKENNPDNIENDSLCHGFFGNVDVLNIINKYDTKKLVYLIQNRIEKINNKGFKDGFNADGDIFSGMIGVTGMALTMLRVLTNNYPSILSLDIYRGNCNE